jgi:hypothetical protein
MEVNQRASAVEPQNVQPQPQPQQQNLGARRRFRAPRQQGLPQQQQQQQPRQPARNADGRLRAPVPRALNRPTNVTSTASPIIMTADDPGRNSLFAHGISIREVDIDTRMTPSATSIIEVSRDMYRELVAHDPNMNKALLPEYLDYYSTAMLWMRIIGIKKDTNQLLSPAEEQVVRILDGMQYSIPEPLMVQLKLLGRIQTIQREHLTPEFPPLPDQQINNFGGFYGPINVDNHNFYEEIPCLGVLAEAVRNSVSNAEPGPYVSSLEDREHDVIPNENLLGFKPLGARRVEAKNLAFDSRITANRFPSDLPGVGLNLRFLKHISAALSETRAFKITTVNIFTMSEFGSIVQVIMQRPVVGTSDTQCNGELFPYSNFGDQESIFGLSIVYTPNLYKEGIAPNQVPEWCCINNPPEPWINNRNLRRFTLPVDYRREAFRALTQSGLQYRLATIRMMVSQRK